MLNSFEMIPVSSSDIEAIGFDETSEDLYVRFISKNSLYVYHNVPFGVFQQFLNASSKGKFLHEHIKNSFQFERKE